MLRGRRLCAFAGQQHRRHRQIRTPRLCRTLQAQGRCRRSGKDLLSQPEAIRGRGVRDDRNSGDLCHGPAHELEAATCSGRRASRFLTNCPRSIRDLSRLRGDGDHKPHFVPRVNTLYTQLGKTSEMWVGLLLFLRRIRLLSLYTLPFPRASDSDGEPENE